jgi:hypothetical protein
MLLLAQTLVQFEESPVPSGNDPFARGSDFVFSMR